MMPAESGSQVSQLEWHRRALARAVDITIEVWPRAQNDLAAIGFPKAVMQPRTSSAGGMTVTTETGAAETVPATAVEIAALNPGHAIAWIAELHDVTRQTLNAAWPGRAWSIDWRPDPVSDLLHAAVEEIADTWQHDDLIDVDPRSANYRRDVLGLYRLADHALAWWPPVARHGDTITGITVGARTNTTETCALCKGPVAGGRADPIRTKDGLPYHGKSCWFTVTRGNGQLHRIIPSKTGVA